jgi:hypothetical protein
VDVEAMICCVLGICVAMAVGSGAREGDLRRRM